MVIKKNYTILAIETSLDDTCAAVTVDDRVVSNVVASQVKFHEEFGGTVPHVARRKHQEWLGKTIDEALRQAPTFAKASAGRQGKLTVKDIDAIAVTYGPGLAPCLEVGILKAKQLATMWKKPLIAVNHMEGHLVSSFAKNSRGVNKLSPGFPQYPALGFLISGGHTQLVLMKGLGEYELLGETLDDAAGEAYDKVARMLNLGYPGGPILSELAREGDPTHYPLPEPMKHRKDLNFSFSGIKTASLYKLRALHTSQSPTSEDVSDNLGGYTKRFTADFAASFQAAVLKMLIRRFKLAIELYHPKMVLLGGGVVSNVVIRAEARKVARGYGLPAGQAGLKVFSPYTQKLYSDNAGMIGVCAYFQAMRGEFVKNFDDLDRKPNLSFETV